MFVACTAGVAPARRVPPHIVERSRNFEQNHAPRTRFGGIREWAGRDIPNEFSRVAHRQFQRT